MRISDWSSDVCSSDLVDDDGDVLRLCGSISYGVSNVVHRGGLAVHDVDDEIGRGRVAVAVDHHVGEAVGHHIVGRRVFRTVLHRSEEHTSELQSLMRISYAVFCLKKQNAVISRSVPTHRYFSAYLHNVQ